MATARTGHLVNDGWLTASASDTMVSQIETIVCVSEPTAAAPPSA